MVLNLEYITLHNFIKLNQPWDFFSILVFFHEHSRFTEQQVKGKAIFLTSPYNFHPLHKQLDIIQAITVESSSLHIASSRTQTGNLRFRSASY